MDLFDLVCYLVAFICFCLAAVGVSARVNLIAAGLAILALVWLLHAFRLVS